MDMFVEAMKLAKDVVVQSEAESPRAATEIENDEYDYPRTFASNHRKLLDVAWKVYDMTSEMKSLKEDVNDLNNKINEIHKAQGERTSSVESHKKTEKRKERSDDEGNLNEGNAVGIPEDVMPARNKNTINSKEANLQFGLTSHYASGKEKRVSFPDDETEMKEMDDLTFSIFKEIADDVVTNYDLCKNGKRRAPANVAKYSSNSSNAAFSDFVLPIRRESECDSAEGSFVFSEDADFSKLNDSLYIHHSRYPPIPLSNITSSKQLTKDFY